MSNDLITYSSDMPAFLKESGGYRDEGLGAGIAPKAPKLSMTTSKQWTITDNGQTIILQASVTDAQGRQQTMAAPSVKGVIVASAQTLTKAWYEKAYVAGSTEAPDCFSNDGKTPAPGVAKPQCSNCAQCPKNAFGSHPVTGRGKACGDRKMIVVALDSMPDKLATFNIPTMSLNSLREIDGKLRSNNIPLQSVMMEFSFDPGIQYPVAKIGAIGFIDKANFEKFRALSESEEVSSLLREVDYDVPAAAAPESVVPNNVIGFGTGGQTATTPVVDKAPEPTAQEVAVANAKAAYEAAVLAAAGGSPTSVGTGNSGGDGGGIAQENEGQGDATNQTAGTTPAPVRRRRTKAEMEAARAASAAPTQAQPESGAGNPLEQATSTALQPETPAEPATPVTPVTGTQPNVLDLLSKWATK